MTVYKKSPWRAFLSLIPYAGMISSVIFAFGVAAEKSKDLRKDIDHIEVRVEKLEQLEKSVIEIRDDVKWIREIMTKRSMVLDGIGITGDKK